MIERDAAQEFLLLLNDVYSRNATLVAAVVEYNRYAPGLEYDPLIATLYPGFTEAEYKAFLDAIDFRYDADYGTQYVFGTVWFSDGSWATRAEYDGCEWWEDRCQPAMPFRT
jgi:hypothetical protein